MSAAELANLEVAKGKLACLLGNCGYAEAARECELRRTASTGVRSATWDVNSIVDAVEKNLKS